jgi:hypothetical protein
MRKKALLTALIITVLTGCATTRNYQSCPAYSQCDELYLNDYNCNIQRRTLTTSRVSTRYAPVPWYYSNNAYYYPNTQSVYYVPIYIESDEQQSFSSTSKKRPSITRNSKN